ANRRVLEGGQAPAREVEEVAVPARLGRVLELREVEVDALTAVGLRASRVEERERGPEDRGVDGRAVDRDVGLVEVEPALAVREERELSRRDPVAFAALAILERELAVDRGETVVRGADRVDEPVAARILVVVQIALGALALGPGIERVDEHGRDRARARDLDPGLPELVGNRRNAPVSDIRRAHRRVAGHDLLVQRSPQDLGALDAELEGARAERVVQEDQILAERRSE